MKKQRQPRSADYKHQFPLVHPNISHPYGNVSKWGEPFFFKKKKIAFWGVKKGAPHFQTSPYTTEVFTGLGEGLRDWIRLDWIRLD